MPAAPTVFWPSSVVRYRYLDSICTSAKLDLSSTGPIFIVKRPNPKVCNFSIFRIISFDKDEQNFTGKSVDARWKGCEPLHVKISGSIWRFVRCVFHTKVIFLFPQRQCAGASSIGGKAIRSRLWVVGRRLYLSHWSRRRRRRHREVDSLRGRDGRGFPHTRYQRGWNVVFGWQSSRLHSTTSKGSHDKFFARKSPSTFYASLCYFLRLPLTILATV